MSLHGFLIGQTETLLAEVLRLNGPADAWTVSFALSFGGAAEILSPEPLRRMAAERLTKALAKYA